MTGIHFRWILPLLVATSAFAQTPDDCPALRVSPDGPELRIGMTREAVEALVGKPDRTSHGTPEYLARGFAIVDDAEGKVAALLAGQSGGGPLAEAFTGSIAGVAVGDSRESVVARLGSPGAERSEGPRSFLTFAEHCLQVSLTDGKVQHLAVARVIRRKGTAAAPPSAGAEPPGSRTSG